MRRFGVLLGAIFAASCDSSPQQPPEIVGVEIFAGNEGCGVRGRTVSCGSVGKALQELPVSDRSTVRIYAGKEVRYEQVGQAIDAISGPATFTSSSATIPRMTWATKCPERRLLPQTAMRPASASRQVDGAKRILALA